MLNHTIQVDLYYGKKALAGGSLEAFDSVNSRLSYAPHMGQNQATAGPEVLVFVSIYQGSILSTYF